MEAKRVKCHANLEVPPLRLFQHDGDPDRRHRDVHALFRDVAGAAEPDSRRRRPSGDLPDTAPAGGTGERSKRRLGTATSPIDLRS